MEKKIVSGFFATSRGTGDQKKLFFFAVKPMSFFLYHMLHQTLPLKFPMLTEEENLRGPATNRRVIRMHKYLQSQNVAT